MKIKAILCDQSDHNHTAFRTQPQATNQVVEFAIKNYLGEEFSGKYAVKDGLFIVARAWIPKEQVALYQDAITDAEIFWVKGRHSFQKRNSPDCCVSAQNAMRSRKF